MKSPDIAGISCAPERLTVQWSDGVRSEFASLWLRDNLPEDRDPHSGQRLVDIVDLPERSLLRSAALEDGGVRIEWQGEPRPTNFSVQWLAAHAFGRESMRPELHVSTWLEGAGMDARRDFAWASVAALRTEPELRLQWLTALLRQGMAFMNEVPAEQSAILDVLPLVGRVLETNYGLTFDVRSVAQPENLAYSDLGLGLHTDNPYRDPVPGFQALHALLPSREGGASLFADGFALAEHLRASAPEHFRTLTATPVPFLYRSSDAELYAERPLIQLSVSGQIAAVHYNNRSIAPLKLSAADMGSFYAAYRHFAALMREPRFQLATRLGEGTLVVFDNQRILHGRTAFSSARHPRHLRGCYLSRDSVYSEAALLRRKLAGRKDPP
ncbi:MAG: TauD/TfdA family dioxygenase [Proteobacteria bacterium]|nr:TauD/TfdA family dioxygenase [Pseudomonadota bacterium]